MSEGVKVVARFRPPNKLEKSKGLDKIIAKIDEDVRVTVGGKHKKKFDFDRVYHWTCTQEEVYKYSAAPLVSTVLQGFNVTMFAYGQTGSGKTYSMEGDENNPGIIPRMVESIFDSILDCEEELEFLVQVTYVEIYNEKIKDLLEPSNQDLRVREKRDQGVYIDGAASLYVGSPEEVFQLSATGHLNRSVTATQMNEGSSRSHAVFMLRLTQTSISTGAKKISKVMLVDLAGSEKVRKTGATGSTLREAQKINQSLSCLGLVISSLTTGKTHIPYRNSQLTRILSDSLGGNSKTCIIVTLSPCEYNIEETVSTLRFGTNCKRVKNKPKVNQELSIAEYKKIVNNLNRQISKLKEANGVLVSQVGALKKALQSGDTNVDIDALLQTAAADKGVEISREQAAATQNMSPSEDVTGQIVELEEAKDNLEDQLQDMRSELEIAENQRDAFREEISGLQKRIQDSEESRRRLINQQGQLKFYKEKVEYMEKEHKLEVDDYRKRLQEARRKVEESLGMSDEVVDLHADQQLDDIEFNISQDKPVPYEMFDQFKKMQEKKYKHVISKMKEQLDEAKNAEQAQANAREIENIADLSTDDRTQTVHKLLTEKQELRRKNTELGSQNEKYSQQMKAFAQREQYNDKLRRNWQTQLRQMEQALLLSNQINNQNRAKYQQTITEKDSEIAKLRAYVTHQLHRQRTMRRGTRIAKPIKPTRGGKSAKVSKNAPKPISKRTIGS